MSGLITFKTNEFKKEKFCRIWNLKSFLITLIFKAQFIFFMNIKLIIIFFHKKLKKIQSKKISKIYNTDHQKYIYGQYC